MQKEQYTRESIIIVDDKPDNLRLLARMLTDRGFKVRPAPSGAHALTTVRKELPDLILLDIMMPEMDGYEVCRQLKSDTRTGDVPVIFLSALDELKDKIKGFEVGGVDYITKPFHEKEVMQRVEIHLNIRRLQQKLQTETARFKALTEAAFEAILIHARGCIIDVNLEAARLFGCLDRELIGADLLELIPPDIRQHLISNQFSTIESEIIRKDGSRIAVEIRTKNFPSKDQRVIAIRDLTRQKKAEQQKQELLRENSALRESMQDRYKFGPFIGRSPSMQKVYELISKAAASEFPALIFGESGTGKELAAQTVHALSPRQAEPFVTVNCGAVTESLWEREFFGHRKGAYTGAVRDEPGFFDTAHKGTLFLDELGELSLAMQVKLLRVLESGEYTPVGDVAAKKADVRIIVATNNDLLSRVQGGEFREDLFYRINVIQITIPPLRERREDIRLLVEHTLSRYGAEDRMASLPAKLREMLVHYDWPGNVRELMNTIQRFLATDAVSLPGLEQKGPTKKEPANAGLHTALETLERRMIAEALQRTNWRRGKTAELLQIPRRSLQRKMLKYQLRSAG